MQHHETQVNSSQTRKSVSASLVLTRKRIFLAIEERTNKLKESLHREEERKKERCIKVSQYIKELPRERSQKAKRIGSANLRA